MSQYTPPRPGYPERVKEQGDAWLGGVSNHNMVDDECTPDFSCCVPGLFIEDRMKRLRIVNEWRRSRGYPEVG